MGEGTHRETSRNPRTPEIPWKAWALRLVLVLWVLQLAWPAWQLREETADLGRRLWTHAWGEAIRREDAFYGWLLEVQRRLPADAVYVFLDHYEAGKEIEARYHLFPREHLLRQPGSPPSLFFYTLRQHQASHLLVRDSRPPSGPGLRAALNLGAAEPLDLPGPGAVYRVQPQRLTRGFYD